MGTVQPGDDHKEEVLDGAFLDAILPYAVFAADRYPGEDGIRFRQQLAAELERVIGIGQNSLVLLPGPRQPAADAYALQWIQAGIIQQVARHKRPDWGRR